MKRFKSFSIFFAAILFFIPGAGFVPALSADGKDTITVVMHAPLKVLDPHNNTALTAGINAFLIYDSLFSRDSNLQIRPQMVDKWQVSADNLTYTFTLRKGLRFHDGKPVTSDDVIASLKRYAQGHPVGKMLADRTREYKKINDKTFQLVLKEPFGLVLYALGGTRAWIMPERIAGKVPISDQITDYTGSGPFVFVQEEFKPGDQAVFVKNETYVPRNEPPNGEAGGKIPYLKRIVWKNIPDRLTAINALNAGEIDYIESVSHDLITMVKGQKGLVVEALNPFGRQGILRMNWLHAPFDNPKIRRAVGYAINQIDFLQATYGDPEYYRVCKTIYSCKSPFATDEGTEGILEGNSEKARQLLKEAGYDGTPVALMNPTDVNFLTPYGLVAAQALRKAGFTVNILSMDWGTLANRRANPEPVKDGGWNIFHTSWPTDITNTPATNIPLASGGKDGGAWFGWPNDSQIQQWINQFPTITDSDEQKKLAGKIQKRAYELGVYFPVGEFLTPSAYSSRIKGALKTSTPVFWNMKKE